MKDKLSVQDVLPVLDRLALHYPNCHQITHLPLLAQDYAQDCGHMSPALFQEAVALARSRSLFFPKSCQILEAENEIRLRIPEYQPLQALNVSPKEERRRQIVALFWCGLIREMLIKKPRRHLSKAEREQRFQRYCQEIGEEWVLEESKLAGGEHERKD